MNFDHSIDALKNLLDNFGGKYFSSEEQAAETEVINKMAVEPKENIYDYYEEENKMKEDKNMFKERLLMEYTNLVEEMVKLQNYINQFNSGDSEITQNQNTYLQLMGKQLEGMMQYRQSLYQRIMMFMTGEM